LFGGQGKDDLQGEPGMIIYLGVLEMTFFWDELEMII